MQRLLDTERFRIEIFKIQSKVSRARNAYHSGVKRLLLGGGSSGSFAVIKLHQFVVLVVDNVRVTFDFGCSCIIATS
jgi:hypothetical protein